MKNRRKAVSGMVGVLSTLLAASAVYANDSITYMAPLFANVNATSAGTEVIMPYFKYNDVDKNGYYESLTYFYNILPNNSTTRLYYSTPKSSILPAVTCSSPTWKESYSNPQFTRYGKWVVTGHDMVMECNGSGGYKEVHNTFVYVADTSKSGGIVNTLILNNNELESIELINYNSDGVQDLMISMHVEGAATEKIRVVVKDFATWATLSDKTFAVSNIP